MENFGQRFGTIRATRFSSYIKPTVMLRRRFRLRRPWILIPLAVTSFAFILLATVWIAQPSEEILRRDYFQSSSLVGQQRIGGNRFPERSLDSAKAGSSSSKAKIPEGRKQKEYVDRKGIHVVVGYYNGDPLSGAAAAGGNLTEEILNRNEFNPVKGAGDQGLPVIIPSHQHSKMNALFRVNQFNLLASDRIPLNRSLPDIRKKKCIEINYDEKDLPSTSVIIVFHNEAWSTLLRTIHSVINRSPRHLLKEIILVDDFSTRAFLKQPLEDYTSKLPVPTSILRTSSRVGLIQARLLGAKKASGDTLTFLDAHCETTTGWLEPLLARVAENPSAVVSPVIDIISDESFAYVRSFDLHWGAFNWQLHFRWFAVGEDEIKQRWKDQAKPFRTPVMAGGLFTIRRDYFYSIGAYDEAMDIWGGENVEMSFRVWQCGGRVEIAPCSHVGHVFRKSSPYTFPREGGVGEVLYSNLARVALVWMDEWRNFYLKLNPEAARLAPNLNVTNRVQLREKLGCKSFAWFLENIWPENFFPSKSRFFGRVRNLGTEKCLRRPLGQGGQAGTGEPALDTCVIEIFTTQAFVVSEKGYIMTDDSVCLDSPDAQLASPQVRFLICGGIERQRWAYDPDAMTIVHVQSGKCLRSQKRKIPSPRYDVGLATCEDGDKSQQWIFDAQDWQSASSIGVG